MEDKTVLKTVHLKSFYSVPLCWTLNLSKNISFQPRENPKIYKPEQVENWIQNIDLDKIFGPKNIEHACLPILNGNAPPPPPPLLGIHPKGKILLQRNLSRALVVSFDVSLGF